MPQHEITVESWFGLADSAQALDDVGGQAAAAFIYAQGWVARPEGFRPSPVCLLRPLGEVMDVLFGVLGAAGDLVEGDLVRLADAVRAASAGLREGDAAVALGLPGLSALAEVA